MERSRHRWPRGAIPIRMASSLRYPSRSRSMNPPARNNRARPYTFLPVSALRSRSCRLWVQHRPSCLRHLSGGGRGRGDRLALRSQTPMASQHSSKQKACVDRARPLAATASRNARAEACPRLRLSRLHARRMRSRGLQISDKHPFFLRNFLLASRGPYQSTDAPPRQVQNCLPRLPRMRWRRNCRAN